MAEVYTVSRINEYVSNMLSNDFFLSNVSIKGELSRVILHSSGHIYFTIKDEECSMPGMMYASSRKTGLDFVPEDGQSVIISGYVSLFKRDGKYQLYARKITLDGQGILYFEYEKLKQRLYEEGLFDHEHKKPIPAFPKKVGIVTSPTGAAIEDICNIAKRRNPYVQLYLYPAKVQGEGAAATIVRGIKKLDTMGMDTIIIGRGGGSIEDLWPFNEEIVARAIYDANTPIISGTGHEIDNTLADYAADLRAPTPSAACELAIPDIMEKKRTLAQYERTLKQKITGKVNMAESRYRLLSSRLEAASPVVKYNNQCMKIKQLEAKLNQLMKNVYDKRYHLYEVLLTRLNGLSPTARLTGGYGYIEHDGRPLTSVKNVKEGDDLSVTVCDGTIHGSVVRIEGKDN
ncbi:MAG: exodeoxyribonuclease VII large subunit [Lachnospiraceae bacterium]|jgi:exodeoxyribonuclease VII large subunit|nr:exodeoxyribonuclease VII large subunit [Lachnospiraceae bacterium]